MRERALELLADMTQDMLDAHDRSARLKVVTDAALRLTPADHASVRLCVRSPGTDPRNSLRLSVDESLHVGARSGVGSDRPPASYRKGEGVLGWVAANAKSACIPDSRHDARFAPNAARGYDVSSLLSVPILARGETLGVLSLSAPEIDVFRDEHQALALLLARTAAQALVTSEFEELSVTDSQTLAYNRRYLLPRLREEMERSMRHREPLSVMLIDLDHFKRVNDGHGHAIGDALLRAFADTVREHVRSIDVLVRRGGEEFVLIMPSTDACAAEVVAERLRVRLSDAPLPVRDGLGILQTISVGVATWDGQEGPESIDERADAAMYEAKQHGRNRVVLAPGHDAIRGSGVSSIGNTPDH